MVAQLVNRAWHKGEAAESGFTLLEIMLVIVIMAVSAMMVAPSYFSAVSVSLEDEGTRLSQVLRLTSEEATLTGKMIRVRFRQHGYQFQSADQAGVWHAFGQAPYQPYTLADGIQIVDIQPTMPLTEQLDQAKPGDPKKESEPVLADLLFTPEGMMKVADIFLAFDPDDGHRLTVQLRPGPGGIVVKNE